MNQDLSDRDLGDQDVVDKDVVDKDLAEASLPTRRSITGKKVAEHGSGARRACAAVGRVCNFARY